MEGTGPLASGYEPGPERKEAAATPVAPPDAEARWVCGRV